MAAHDTELRMDPLVGQRGLYTEIVRTLGQAPRYLKAALVAQATELLAAEEAETSVLIIDEAHLLSGEQLEEVRMLTNHDMDLLTVLPEEALWPPRRHRRGRRRPAAREVKSHKDIQLLDELELAFYWMLLEPSRTQIDVSSVGRLILRRGGRPELVEVAIRPHCLDQVLRLVERVRTARRHGVRPRICGCTSCSGVWRQQVYQVAIHRKDLSLIIGISRRNAGVLEGLGVASWEDLLRCDDEAVAASFRTRGYPAVTAVEVARWRQHARSYALGRPVVFDDLPTSGGAASFPVHGSFIALDLEYDSDCQEPGSLIWLVGACVVDGDLQEHVVLWADSTDDEERNLGALGELVRCHPGLPVVTWRAAAQRARGCAPPSNAAGLRSTWTGCLRVTWICTATPCGTCDSRFPAWA